MNQPTVAKTPTNKPLAVNTPIEKLMPEKKINAALENAADKAMGIFDRIDKTKTVAPKALHSADLKNDKDVEYFLKKAEELENLYKKTVVHVYTDKDEFVSAIPVTNLEDGTDLTEGRTTLRNTLHGLVNKHEKVKAFIQPSGINYPDKKVSTPPIKKDGTEK